MKDLNKPSRLELIVDRFLESNLALFLAGFITAIFITAVFFGVIIEGIR